jgi:hypothetical protein
MLASIGCFFVGDLGAFGLFRDAKVTLMVVDDNGQPVSSAKVGVGFDGPGGKYTGKNGITGEDGLFTAVGECLGKIQYSAEKPGYYSSNYSYSFKSMGKFHWEPWNPTFNVLLRKIEDPVQMYVRDTLKSIIEIPVIDKEVGFDLIIFDWVTPYGNGKNADFVFKLERNVVDRMDFDATLTMKFLGKHTGIQPHKESRLDGSQLHLPRYAPDDGYQDELVLRKWRNPAESSIRRNFNFNEDDMNYFFRVRSEVKNGNLIKAMYGKIQGPIEFSVVHSKTAKIYFKYYLNPDYTLNLEFDPKRNLFGNLSSLEQVKEP